VATENVDLTRLAGGRPANARLAEIFLAETALLRKVIAGMGLRAHDAEDVLQTVSVKCLNHGPVCADQSQCRRWLIRVTTNECITKHRRVLRFRRHAASITEHSSQTTADGPVENAISSEQIAAVQEALGDMDDELLRPLVLKYFCDLSSAEIGATLNVPASTARSMLRKGRMALAKALMNRGVER
jgi:RNA polymerase sigma-70 factor (ECF subfamily)